MATIYSLSVEIIQLIISNLYSQRYIASCLLVNREWYAISLILLYQKVNFYTQKQLQLYLTNESQHCQLTKHIKLNKDITITIFLVERFQTICPNLLSIRYTMEQLSPMETISFELIRSTIITTTATAATAVGSIQEKQQHPNPIYTTEIEQIEPNSKSLLLSCDSKIKNWIMQHSNRLIKLHFVARLYNPFPLTLEKLTAIDSIISTTMTFNNLTELSISNGISTINSSFVISIHTMFDHIHTACPQLESLCLENYSFLVMENDSHLSTNTTINPMLSLKQLFFRHIILNNKECYDFLSKKMPMLTRLDFYLIPPDDYGETGELTKEMIQKQHRDAFYSMLIRYQHLSKLKINYALDQDDTYYEDIEELCPSIELLARLRSFSNQFTCIGFPLCFEDISHVEELYDDNDINYHDGFLHNISELGMILTSNPSCLLNFLLIPQNLKQVSSSLTTLKLTCLATDYVHLDDEDRREDGENFYSIDIVDWLDALPALKSFEITRYDIFVNLPIFKHSYRLESLKLKQIYISTGNGLDKICQACPRLTQLYCEDMYIYGDQKDRNGNMILSPPTTTVTSSSPTLNQDIPSLYELNLSHLNLDQLMLKRIWIIVNQLNQKWKNSLLKRLLPVNQIHLNELNRNKECIIMAPESTNASVDVKINVKSQMVDQAKIHYDNHYMELKKHLNTKKWYLNTFLKGKKSKN
ncbi:unnamed protein product [Cunninghamella echinulata]